MGLRLIEDDFRYGFSSNTLLAEVCIKVENCFSRIEDLHLGFNWAERTFAGQNPYGSTVFGR